MIKGVMKANRKNEMSFGLRALLMVALFVGCVYWLDPAWRFVGNVEGIVTNVDRSGRFNPGSVRGQVKLLDGTIVFATIDGVGSHKLGKGDAVSLVVHESLIFRQPTYIGIFDARKQDGAKK